MSVLNALDATRICTRWSPPLADPAAWRMPAPNVARRQPAPALMQQGRYSWWSVVRNPHAMLVTGVVGTILAKDAMLRILSTVRRTVTVSSTSSPSVVRTEVLTGTMYRRFLGNSEVFHSVSRI
jgi:hypothetical protein